METPEKEVEQVNTGLVTAQNDIRSVEESLKGAERYLELMDKIRKASIRLTNNLDWSNQGGKPYLEKSGCDKIASAFGVKVFDITFVKEKISDDKGDYIIYSCHGKGRWNNHETEETGTCSTRDDFFGKGTTADGQKGWKPLSEVDLTDIMKKAQTNLSNRLIKKLIGLSFSWEEIKELSGDKISAETVLKVDFAKGARGGNSDSPETKKLRDECRATLLKLNDGEEGPARAMLIQMTAFQGKDGLVAGKDHISKLSEKQVQILHGKLKKGIADLDAQTTAAAAAPVGIK